MSYAENTSVPVNNSIGEIQRIIERYGADEFMFATKKEAAMIMFVAENKQIKMIIPLPCKTDKQFNTTPTGRKRKNPSTQYEQEIRRRWRSLSLAIKAKLEAVETGIATFEQEFLAYTVLPNGQTVGDFVIPQIKKHKMPKQLPFLIE